MNVWIQNPFDNLPVEGYRKQRFWLMGLRRLFDARRIYDASVEWVTK